MEIGVRALFKKKSSSTYRLRNAAEERKRVDNPKTVSGTEKFAALKSCRLAMCVCFKCGEK